MLRTLFSCCAPSLLPRHSVHIASDVTSVWRACCELVASMLRWSSKHQMQGWWAVGRASDFFPPSGVWSGALPLYIYRKRDYIYNASSREHIYAMFNWFSLRDELLRTVRRQWPVGVYIVCSTLVHYIYLSVPNIILTLLNEYRRTCLSAQNQGTVHADLLVMHAYPFFVDCVIRFTFIWLPYIYIYPSTLFSPMAIFSEPPRKCCIFLVCCFNLVDLPRKRHIFLAMFRWDARQVINCTLFIYMTSKQIINCNTLHFIYIYIYIYFRGAPVSSQYAFLCALSHFYVHYHIFMCIITAVAHLSNKKWGRVRWVTGAGGY
jgi:hypothetical protein